MSNQKVVFGSQIYKEMDVFFKEYSAKCILIVCGNSMSGLEVNDYFEKLPERLKIKVEYYKEFIPNPQYSSVVDGVKFYHEKQCDAIVAVGGGSAIDVAKCIKLYAKLDKEEDYFKQKMIASDIPFIAIPTTAGTGSEATSFAVIYHNGEKQSVSDVSCVPDLVCMQPEFLNSLPLYQRKVTMMDAFCHAIESFWSVHSTKESKEFSEQAIRLILKNKDAYMRNEEKGNESMMKAAYLAGKAINIAKTTAGHAMCYKLTSLYGIAHGHAAALCVSKLWPYMVLNSHKCVDLRGREYLEAIFDELADIIGVENCMEAAKKFQKFLDELLLEIPVIENKEQYDILIKSVNQERLANNPVQLTNESIDFLYHEIVNSENDGIVESED